MGKNNIKNRVKMVFKKSMVLNQKDHSRLDMAIGK